jgi:hypothetical protein
MSVNMDEFDKNVDRAKTGVRQATQFILKQFVELNTSLAGPAAASGVAALGASALRLVPAFTAVVVAAKLVGDVITATKERLAEMVEVAEKAQARGVSAEFFQAFIFGAKGAEDQIASFEAALANAFQATKPILNPDWTVWDQGITKISAIEKAIKETRELFTTDQNFSGATAFLGTKDQDTKIRAVLLYMTQLKDIGQEIAALDVGEKMFGSKFIDDIRTGKTSLESVKRTLEEGSKLSFISNENAKNAKDLDDRLNEAYFTLNDKFKPSIDDIAAASLKVKEIWTSIVEQIAAVAGSSVNFSGHDDAATFGRFARPSSVSGDESAGLNLARRADDNGFGGPVPLPHRRPLDAPKPVAATPDDSRDQFEISIDSITKHIATLNADTAAMFQNNAAKQQLRAEFQALTAIMRDEGEVTQAQIDKYEKLRQSMTAQQALTASGIVLTKEHSEAFLSASAKVGTAATAYDKAGESLSRINSASSQLGSALSTAFADAVVEGKKLNEVFSSLIKTLEKAAINSLFASFFNPAASGGLSSFAKLVGFNAEGTDNWRGGPTWVGEKGPEIVNLPRGAQVDSQRRRNEIRRRKYHHRLPHRRLRRRHRHRDADPERAGGAHQGHRRPGQGHPERPEHAVDGGQPMTDIPLFPRGCCAKKAIAGICSASPRRRARPRDRRDDRPQRRRRLLVLRDERYQPERPQGHAGAGRDRQKISALLWRAVRQVCDGGVNLIVVPRNDALFRPWPAGVAHG